MHHLYTHALLGPIPLSPPLTQPLVEALSIQSSCDGLTVITIISVAQSCFAATVQQMQRHRLSLSTLNPSMDGGSLSLSCSARPVCVFALPTPVYWLRSTGELRANGWLCSSWSLVCSRPRSVSDGFNRHECMESFRLCVGDCVVVYGVCVVLCVHFFLCFWWDVWIYVAVIVWLKSYYLL